MIAFIFASLAFALTYNGEEMHYAVLISGSNGYMNYRHQADVCHAYHVLLAGGMPEENIIVLSVDDAATSSENPFPGKLYNKPTKGDAKPVDVREGCNIDYKGRSVTKQTFVAVLTGDADYASTLNGTGRVLHSTSTDNVFLNFVDHGGVKIIGFPNGKTMKANELYDALKTMHSKSMYKNLVFYMEACESGSMFPTLPEDMNIYALTAANGKESSWGTYCPPMDVINGKHLKTCLGDLFSINWMEETDKERSRPFNITLERQYHVVKRETNKSHVMQFGDLSIVSEKIDVFEGDVSDDEYGRSLEGFVSELELKEKRHHHMKLSSAVDSRDIRLHVFYNRYITADNDVEREESYRKMNEELSLRHKFDSVFTSFKESFGLTSAVESTETNWDCYSNTIDYFQEVCGKPNEHDYVMKYYGLLHDACLTQSEENIQKALSSLCH